MMGNEERALASFAASVRAHYGDRLDGIFLYGSRARGDARSESDADVIVLLADGPWSFWAELRLLSGLAYEPLLAEGISIHPWPMSRSDWDNPAEAEDAVFVTSAKRDAQPLPAAA